MVVVADLGWLFQSTSTSGHRGAPRAGAQLPADGELLPFGNEHLRVLATPGHTRHCLSFLWRDRLFCGGLLAVDACPHQPCPADPAALWDSVTRRVFTLADETLLFSGHEQRARAVSTVLEQRRWHPHFAQGSRDAFLARAAALSCAPNPDRPPRERSPCSA